MDAVKMLEQYKNSGDRVDEVLFHTVAKELGRLRVIIDQKNFSIDLIGEQKLDAQKENKRLREVLEFYADSDWYHLKHNNEIIILNDAGEKARQALEGGENN
ncbi:hypothetical protein [Lysinibacillus sp. NPDC096212]|uniref:hypothetical protein n=1 Tax=Lysinibacillus sp. NPDC096212 TaxID=3364135 RepID=UPI0038246C1C